MKQAVRNAGTIQERRLVLSAAVLLWWAVFGLMICFQSTFEDENLMDSCCDGCYQAIHDPIIRCPRWLRKTGGESLEVDRLSLGLTLVAALAPSVVGILAWARWRMPHWSWGDWSGALVISIIVSGTGMTGVWENHDNLNWAVPGWLAGHWWSVWGLRWPLLVLWVTVMVMSWEYGWSAIKRMWQRRKMAAGDQADVDVPGTWDEAAR